MTLRSVTGLQYDFQDGGEFVALNDGYGMQIQSRQTPVPGAPWVSVNTAVAAQVGAHRVTWQPSLSGVPSPSGLELRVDGVLSSLGGNGLDWGVAGRVSLVGKETLQIDFPEGTTLMVTPHWWPDQSQWYLTVNVFHSTATLGLMGDLAAGSWQAPDFGDAWRVTPKTSLFDYAPGASTKDFSFPHFPASKIPPVKPENRALAVRVCAKVKDQVARRRTSPARSSSVRKDRRGGVGRSPRAASTASRPASLLMHPASCQAAALSSSTRWAPGQTPGRMACRPVDEGFRRCFLER